MLIRAYRIARPPRRRPRSARACATAACIPSSSPKTYGFTEADYDRPIFIDRVLGLERRRCAQILGILRRTYCRHIGVEYMHISDPEQKAWIQERIEGEDKDIRFTAEGKKAILDKLIEAETFERFCEVKYTGTKRFGLDGGEAMVPALEQIIKRGGQLGVREIVIGMAAPRPPQRARQRDGQAATAAIFNEFKGGSFKPDDVEGSGDVKYHLGASSDRAFDGNNVHLSLTANPSHLEIVDPVVLGKVRAKQDQLGCDRRARDGAAAADPRRCGLRRPGRGGGVLRPLRPQGPPHRRLDPLHHQQPDRLHHRPALLALLALSARTWRR